MRQFKLVLLVTAVVLMLGCGTELSKNEHNTATTVLTTTGMIEDLVRNIGGDAIEMRSLMGPGVDPHLYKASAGDLDKLQGADIIFFNGLELEGKMEDIFANLERSGKPTYAIGEFIPKELLMESESYKNRPDPHIWFNVAMWASTIDGVAEALATEIPDHAEEFAQNAENYKKELTDLHTWCVEQFNLIPREQRVLITAHDAFKYFGKAYDVDVVGLQGISTASEYGPRDIERIVNLIVERKIKAVFIESSVPKRSIEAVVEGARHLGQGVIIGGELFSDAMGEEGTPEGTFVGMVRHNVTTIVEALR